MKFIMALCVVTIHTFFVENMEPSIIRDLLHSLICSAVPFFFITSAYFVMQRNENGGILKYWKRIFQLYLSWSVINFISVSLINRNLCVENVQTCIYQILFNGYSVLWYLWGILIALPLLIKLRDGGAKPKPLAQIRYFMMLLGFMPFVYPFISSRTILRNKWLCTISFVMVVWFYFQFSRIIWHYAPEWQILIFPPAGLIARGA